MFKGFKSLVAGLLAGTALGVLFSPNKGEDIRNKIKEEIDSGGNGLNAVKDTLTAMGKDIGETASDAYEDFEKNPKVKKKKAKAKKYVKKTIDEHVSKDTQKKAKSAYSKAKKGAKKAASEVKKAASKVKKKNTPKKK